MEHREYEVHSKIDDIKGYPNLFIRDGDLVFLTDKHTGEILKTLTIKEAVDLWVYEWKTNNTFRNFYERGLTFPKHDPDTAKNISELKKLCSDNTRHRKGDTGYLLDFIMQGDCSKTESKIFLHLSKSVLVWNYCTTTLQELKVVSELKSDKQVKAVWKSLQDKGLLSVVNQDFSIDDSYKMLVKLHPKLYWEGRYSAWLVKCKADYEYEDPITV